MSAKLSLALMSILLAPILIFPFQSSFGYSTVVLTPSSEVEPVSILTSAHSVIPNLVIIGLPTTLEIRADPNPLTLPHNGTEIQVWDAAANPFFPMNQCPLPGSSGGISWELRADTDMNLDFIDAGSAPVSYNITASDGSIMFEFGDGGFVTISISGSAIVAPAGPTITYAWVEVDGTGAAVGPSGTDNTNVAGRYEFGSCGTEQDDPVSLFLGTTTFNVVEGCVQRTVQPKDPVSMNTVRNGNIVKTIHAEKILFDCKFEQGDIPITADVTIIAEIYEDMSTKSIIKKQAIHVTCIKEPVRVQVLECNSGLISGGGTVARNCVEEEAPAIIEQAITHPQEMNTVNKGNIVKTIEAQKEIFRCLLRQEPLEIKKVDLVLFTEIWEDLSLLPSNPVIKTTFLSMRCVIDTSTSLPTVESCIFKNIPN
jgi:hypothetical protein